jgi:hypothetical protein
MDEAEFQRLLQLFPAVRSRDYTVLLSLSQLLLLLFLGFRTLWVLLDFLSLLLLTIRNITSLLFKDSIFKIPICEFCGLHAAYNTHLLIILCFEIVLD